MTTKGDFRQVYCAHHGIKPDEYADHLLKRALYTHARVLKILIWLTNRNFFRADYDFLHEVGDLRRYRDFEQAVEGFIYHPWNTGNFFRSRLLLRISTTRVRKLVRKHLVPKPNSL